MSPDTRAAVRMLLSALQAGIIGAGGVLLATKDFTTPNLLIAGVVFLVAAAKNIEAYLTELPPPR